MTAGKLAAAKPAATTNTTLYKCAANNTSSVVLQVCNQSASATSYRTALRDYDVVASYTSGSYTLRKGNIFSDYTLTVSPSLTGDTVPPGTVLQTETVGSNFSYADIIKPTDTINYEVKVVDIGIVGANNQTGPGFALESTLTGFDTGLTATYYGSRTGNIVLNIASVSDSATSVIVSNDLNEANDLIIFDSEIAEVTAVTGYTLSITRGMYGSTAVIIEPGVPFVGIRPLTTTSINEGATFDDVDTVLTVADTSNISLDSYIQIDNEFLYVDSIDGFDVTVVRGALGTTAASHPDASTVTPYSNVNSGYANFFSPTETLDDGVASTIDLNVTDTFNQLPKFLLNIGNGGFEFPTSFGGDVDRVIRFDLSDASLTGTDFRLGTVADGIWGVDGVEYTTGVTTSGTPGTAGAYLEIDLSYDNVTIASTTQVFPYNELDEQYTNNMVINIILNPFYNTISVYNFDETVSVGDSFLYGTTQYTVTGIKPGPYGYVMNTGTSTSVKLSYGPNSPEFPLGSAPTTTITGSSGDDEIVVGSASGLVVGMRVSGTGISPGAYITDISGTTLTLSADNIGAVSGTGTFSYYFYDSPFLSGSERNLIEVTSTSAINAEDYIFYDKTLSANSSEKHSGIVVGPGNSLMVYSTDNTISYLATGFEDITNDFSEVYYNRQRPE